MTRQEQIAEYQRLLCDEWDESTMTHAQALLRSFDAYVEGLVAVRRDHLTALGKIIGFTDDSLGVSFDLVVGLLAVRETGDGLLRDVVGLLADLAADKLWENSADAPSIGNVLLLVAQRLYEDAPARRHALEGEISDARGDKEAALGSWLAALATTDPDDHDYLSHVQTVWFAYLALGRDADALRLVEGLPSNLHAKFIAELAAGLARRPRAEDVAGLRVRANLAFGSSPISEQVPHTNSLAPRDIAANVGSACNGTT